MIVVTVLLSDLVSIRDRGTYQGYLNLIGAAGSAGGGPIGMNYSGVPAYDFFGWLTGNRRSRRADHWVEMVRCLDGGRCVQADMDRRIFLIQVILCLIAIIAVAFLLHLPQRKTDISLKDQLKRIDFLGAVLLILSIFALLFGLDRGTNISWHSPTTLVSLCLTVPLVAAFLLVETKIAIAPFTPGHVIFDRALFACYTQNFFSYAHFTALIFYLPTFFQVVLLMTPAQAGAALIPAVIPAVIGTFVGGLILKRIGKYYWLALVSAWVGALASIPIAAAPSLRSGSFTTICVTSIVSFFPQGIVITSSLIAIRMYYLNFKSAVTDYRSFKCRSGGPGSRHCINVSIPFPWSGDGCFPRRSTH